MYECVTHNVPFVLAGSIRDDGPLPETVMDLIDAQEQYAAALSGDLRGLRLAAQVPINSSEAMVAAGCPLRLLKSTSTRSAK
jgi:hypothetical protein